jgi:hypothetical protein
LCCRAEVLHAELVVSVKILSYDRRNERKWEKLSDFHYDHLRDYNVVRNLFIYNGKWWWLC